jgi:agmatine/peptidylarginine deiminase
MIKFFTFLASFVFFANFQAQETESFLPKGLTQEEKSLIKDYSFVSNLRTPPPTYSVRTKAEGEEIEYLVLSWRSYPNVLRQIVAAAVNECKVLIATDNPTSVSSFLTQGGISLTNVEFISTQTNSVWIRDFGGNTAYRDGVGDRVLVDWTYNRPRPLDNALPSLHATHVNSPIFITQTSPNDLVHTGGNYMSDGMGTAFSSKLILQENQAGNPYGVSTKSEAQINTIMQNYMGINRYIKMDQLPFDGINHIDMHMKLLDEETLLVSRYPEGVADGPQITENINYVLSNFNSYFNTPYIIKWIDAPPSPTGNHPDNGASYRTFTNAVFINKTVIVPTYRPEVDGPALAQYQQMLPGYNIVGIDVDNSPENVIAASGAIHCITHTIGVNNPLQIVHQSVKTVNAVVNIPINALIRHRTGIAQAKVFWRVEGTTTFNEVSMTASSNDQWQAFLNIPQNALKIQYYIWAQANSGKIQLRPLVAPQGFWTFEVSALASETFDLSQFSGPFPNPATDYVSFNLPTTSSPIQLTITDISGRSLFSKDLMIVDNQLQINLEKTWSGVLFFNFSGPFGKITKKLIKK